MYSQDVYPYNTKRPSFDSNLTELALNISFDIIVLVNS